MSISPRPAPTKRSKITRRSILIVCTLLLIVIAVLGYKSWRIYERAVVLRHDLQALQAAVPGQLTTDSVEPLASLLDNAHNDAVALRDEARPLYPLMRHVGWLPGYGQDIVAAEPLIDIAVDATTAARLAIDVGLPLLRERDAGHPLPQILATSLAPAQPQLLQVRELLASIAETVKQIPVDSLSPTLRDPLQRAIPSLAPASQAVDAAVALPEVLGANGQQTYLLLIQNPAELRATGGFIGGVGLVSLQQGRVVDLKVEGSEGVDDLAAHAYPDPPQPILEYMSSQLWVFRDANWSPDFPSSAQAAMNLYKLGRGQDVDGVVAIDPALLQALLRVIGPITIKGETEPVTADTILEYMARQYAMGFPAKGTNTPIYRKAFFTPLADAILSKVTSGTMEADPGVAMQTIRQALDEHHAQIYLKQAKAGALLKQYGWDGSVQPSKQDFLMVVDSNVGFNKVNINIKQTIDYTVNLEELANPEAELHLWYKNVQQPSKTCIRFGNPAWQASDLFRGCYFDYVRALLPQDSELISATVQTVPGEWLPSGYDDQRVKMVQGDAETTEFNTIMVLPAGAEQDIVVRYGLPEGVVSEEGGVYHYRLKVQKQSRTETLPVRAIVVLPQNAAVVSTSVAPHLVSDNEWTFDLQLNTDQQVDVAFQLS